MRILTIYNNEIINIGYPNSINDPSDGYIDPATGYLTINLDTLNGVSEAFFMDTHYWDGETLRNRNQRPSPFCYWDSAISDWKINETAFLEEVRRVRNQELTKTDWTQIQDATVSAEKRLEYQAYRQQLRDITGPVLENPEAFIRIEDLPWPTPPA